MNADSGSAAAALGEGADGVPPEQAASDTLPTTPSAVAYARYPLRPEKRTLLIDSRSLFQVRMGRCGAEKRRPAPVGISFRLMFTED
ncbi:hypothetical protein GCM10009560_57670 [Nonomuraea longicatena]|uniref:Uncharacterized protein n=1 Tax=Nonomuraea longicatena TaxID=83682 RepID=A0ABP4B069_9ACTN